MPITLFTGLPGAGKTAQMVWELQQLQEKGLDRPVFVDGVNALQLPHVSLDATKWHLEVPDGALILVDEAQRLWRPTGSGARLPEELGEVLEKHRHRGIDFWMTTQHPRLIHANLRALVGRHVHLRDTGWLGRWWYEWPEISESVAWKSCLVKQKHKLPKSIFTLYKSASEHTKTSRKVPAMAWIAIACVVLALVLAWMVVRSIKAHTAPPAAAAPGVEVKTAAGITSTVAGQAARPIYITDPTAFAPRWAGRPESAPAYDDLVRVKTFPRVVAGFCRGATCSCFTQQGTDAGLSNHECRSWNTRLPFDPYREPPQLAERDQVRNNPAPGEGHNAPPS